MPETTDQSATPKRASRPVLAVMRWLHIYISMLGFLVLLFFAVTGLTLNHPDWFYTPVETPREVRGKLEPELLKVHGLDEEGTDANPTMQVDRLAIVETLRSRHALSGAVHDFSVDEYQCVVVFKGPGYSADAFIDRATGQYQVTELRQGVVAVLNDLHKGRDSGMAWSWIVDISAVLMTVASITGLFLLLASKRRRRSGLITALLGSIATVVIYVLFVP
jgi:hypothetical protein